MLDVEGGVFREDDDVVHDAGSGRVGEDAAQGEVGRICFDGEGELGLKMLEYGS